MFVAKVNNQTGVITSLELRSTYCVNLEITITHFAVNGKSNSF